MFWFKKETSHKLVSVVQGTDLPTVSASLLVSAGEKAGFDGSPRKSIMANECWWQLHKFRPTDFSCCNKNSARSETTRASLNLDIWWSSFVEQLNFREAFSILHHWSNLLDLLLTKKKTTGIEYLPNSSYLGITQSLLYYAVVPLHISLTRGEILKFVISILPDYRTLSNDCSLYFLWSVNFHTILKDNLTALMPEKIS